MRRSRTPTFAARLRLALEQNASEGVGPASPSALAHALGERLTQTRRALRGERLPNLRRARQIALATGRSLDWLVGLADCPECGRTVDEREAKRHCEVGES